MQQGVQRLHPAIKKMAQKMTEVMTTLVKYFRSRPSLRREIKVKIYVNQEI